MITKPTSQEELVQIITEVFFNKTDKITKVSKHSGLSAFFNTTAKVGQKAIQEVARNEAYLYPDSAFGTQLDKIADNYGVASRFGASKSSTYVRVVGNPGTSYISGSQTFNASNESITFDLEEDITISDAGYAYAKVKSQTQGLNTNVDALSITEVVPEPTGHLYTINEYKAIGGRDQESDQLFRRRIKEGANILAAGTLQSLEQAFMKVNNDVLKVFNNGIDKSGKIVLTVVSQNGIDFTQAEFDDMISNASSFFSLVDQGSYGKNINSGIKLKNISWYPIDISYRAQLMQNANADTVRINTQIQFQKYLDIRSWEPGGVVQWDDLLGFAKRIDKVRYIPDQYFNPSNDIKIPANQIPRIRSFIIYDLNGNIITDTQGVLNPVYYPSKSNNNFQQTVLE